MDKTPYTFIPDEIEDNTFAFETGWGSIYEVKFVGSGYLFPNDPDLDQSIFELLIKLVANRAGQSAPPDPRIPPTIAAIFRRFLDDKNERVIVYVCDSSDGRQRMRARKFDGWFHLFKGTTYLKVDGGIVDKEGITYDTSIILRVDNPDKLRIFEAFYTLLADANDKS